MEAKEFYRRYAAQMRREAEDTASDDLKNSFLNLAHVSDRLAEGDADADHAIRL